MGVTDLWTIISPIGEMEVLSSLSGQVLAIDLSCWICDSQKAKMGGAVVRPHLRNLFFRTTTLLSCGVVPVFVIEGEAPKLKLTTMQNRNNNQYTSSGKRTRLKGFLSQCCELLNLLGIPWVQANGEAEATCAALNHFGIVDGVVTQDSDVFLYGGNCVLRNFSANKQKPTFDKFVMEKLERVYGLTRDLMIVMALLLGCDYLPGGVAGIGKEMFLQLVGYWHEIGVTDPIKRFREWKNMNSYGDKKDKKSVEQTIRLKATAHPKFPFDDVIEEFQRKIEKPDVKVKWEEPKFLKLIKFLTRMLEWDVSYCIEKCTPVLTLWMINNCCHTNSLKVERIVKKRVHHGVPSLEVEWTLLDDLAVLGLEVCDLIKTVDDAAKFAALYPEEVSQFEDQILRKKKAKKASKTKSTIIEDFKQIDRSFDRFGDDYIGENDLSAVIDRLVNLKMTDNHKKELKYEEVICISDDEPNNSADQEYVKVNGTALSDDLFADIDGSVSSITPSSRHSLGKINASLLNNLSSDQLCNDSFEMDSTTDLKCNTSYKQDHPHSKESVTRSCNITNKPTFKLFDSPDFLSSSCIQVQEPTSKFETPKKSHDLQESFAFESPEVSVSLMQRLRQKYGAELGKSVNILGDR